MSRGSNNPIGWDVAGDIVKQGVSLLSTWVTGSTEALAFSPPEVRIVCLLAWPVVQVSSTLKETEADRDSANTKAGISNPAWAGFRQSSILWAYRTLPCLNQATV